MIIETAKVATAMVWHKLVGVPERFTIIFCGDLTETDSAGNENCVAACYSMTEDITYMSITAMYRESRLHEDPYDLWTFLPLAHETVHKVQCYRGDPPPAYRKNTDYMNCRHEREAWGEALGALAVYKPYHLGRIRAIELFHGAARCEGYRQILEELGLAP
jgi:hypothetical protein